MADITYSPKFNWDLKPYGAWLGVSVTSLSVTVRPERPGTGTITLKINTGHALGFLGFRDTPAGNCGIMEISGLNGSSLRSPEHKRDWLKFIEAWARSHKRSVLLGNDGAYTLESERPWWFVQKYGEGYNMIETTWNRNYDGNSPHKVGIFYKNIGACHYDNIYGLGQEFNDGSAHYARG